jgi:LAGLIDADG endonuclease
MKHIKKPLNFEDFGYFLAGLIDADGYLRKKELAITLDNADISLEFKFKIKVFGGRIRPYKNRRAFNYELNNVAQLLRVADLIRHKLRLPKRVRQFNTALTPSLKCAPGTLCTESLTHNYWLSGFTFGDGSLQIKLTRRTNSKRYRAQLSLQFSCDMQTEPVLRQIQAAFGGSIGFRKPNTVYYGSCSFAATSKVIRYFDAYPMVFRQRRLYELFRQCYVMINAKRHLSNCGMATLMRHAQSSSILRRRYGKK